MISRLLLLGAVLALSTSALAHRAWIVPSTFTLSGESQWITVQGAISNDLFFPNHVPLPVETVVVTRPDGSKSGVEGWTGRMSSSFDLALDQQGTYAISELGDTWFVRWLEGDEEQWWRGSREEVEAKSVGREGVKFLRSARRVESYVSLGAPSNRVFEPSGVGLELAPITHPNDVFAGEEARFRLLLGGEPAAGMSVEVIRGGDRYRDRTDPIEAVTDSEGNFSLLLEQAGTYWLHAGSEPIALETHDEIHGYTLTLEVLPQ